MKKRMFYYVLVTFFLCSLCVLCGCSEKPAIEIKKVHDLGQLSNGQVVDYTLHFKNKGKARLRIPSIETSCGCTSVIPSAEYFEPGEEGNIQVKILTEGKENTFAVSLTIFTNDPSNKEVKVVFTGTIL